MQTKVQKFKNGDLVRVAERSLYQRFNPETGGTEPCGVQPACNAIVIGSYADQFGGDNVESYTLFVEGGGKTSWFQEGELTMIRHAPDLLASWEEQREARIRDYSDVKWVRKNWAEIRENPSSASILALFRLIDFESAFLRNGEYFCLFGDWESLFPFFDMVLSAGSIEQLRERVAEKSAEHREIAEMVYLATSP